MEEKYEVKEVIGRGAFGIIRKVRRRQDGLILCRKEINYLKMSQKERDQLHAEFSILSSLKHPNIVGYYHREHLKQTQELYIYMEYCGGGDLGVIIKDLKDKKKFAKEEFVWRIFTQLVTALYRCHYGVDPPQPGSDPYHQTITRPDQNKVHSTILHRDLKPENIFLGADQSVKLGDFGLSKIMQSNDFASTYVGTPYYMSPEICAAEKYTLHSDIWSIGCIIYELCMKRPPFDAKTHLQLIQNIRKGTYDELPSHYSNDLKDVIRRCLNTNPKLRPDTASLLTIPYVWIARRQQEIVSLTKAVTTREESAIYKLKQAEERLTALEADRAAMRAELEAQLRREWEVKARLEIDHQVQIELERLQKRFEKEVEERVEARVCAALANHSKIPREIVHPLPPAPTFNKENLNPGSSVNTAGEDDFPSSTDLSSLSLDSPFPITLKPTAGLPPKKTKTPFARARTNLDSPADVHMASPSPITISSLALSPRRNQPRSWEPTVYASDASESESDDDILPLSPTRPKPTTTSNVDPTKAMPSKRPPFANRINTTATMQKLSSKPSLFPIGGAERTSPSRRLSKIPSRTDLREQNALISTSPPRRANTTGGRSCKATFSQPPQPNTSAPSNATTVAGRTRVELAQARAGGRAMDTEHSYSGGGLKSKLGSMELREKELPSVPVWDADELGDDMPSPFLKRDQKVVRLVR